MELKSQKKARFRALDGSFNRTFMELKFEHTGANPYRHPVLIVPLWNWNTDEEHTAHRLDRFNRTFMELKYSFAA